MTIVAVFRSRSQSLDYAERLRKYGVQATAAPAPKEAHIGCGLCVQFDIRVFPKAKAILSAGKYSSFKGFYRLEFFGGKMLVKPY